MKKLIWIGLACLVVFFGCSLLGRDFYRSTDDYFGDPTKGAAVIVLNGGSIPTKTITPNMDVANYELHFTNPTEGEDFTQTISAGSPVYTQSGLTPSTDWHVTVTALNSVGDPIGAIGGNVVNAMDFTVTAGQNVDIPVTVIPIVEDGDGDLRVFVSWPDAAGAVETLTGTLDATTIINAEGGTLNAGTRSYTYTGVQGTGYYTLILQLEDDGALLWGWMEAVRVVDNLPTDTGDQKFELTLTSSGSLALTAGANMNNPVEIDLDADAAAGIQPPPADLAQGSSVTVTAVTTPSGSYTYQWYRDGAAITGETNAAITIVAANEDVGVHNYSILVDDGGTLSSETFTMEILP